MFIAGWTDFSVQDQSKFIAEVSSMGNVLAEKKDNEKIFAANETAMLQRSGKFPKRSEKTLPQNLILGDRKYTITFSGRIFNLSELKNLLKKENHNIYLQTEEELLLALYLVFGDNFINKLNGTFAFAIWDESKKELLLARDKSGGKPLFYYTYDRGIIFASHIYGLLAHSYIEPKLSLNGISSLILLGPARAVGDGVLDGIKELLPAEIIMFNKNGFNSRCYWQLKAKQHIENAAETTEHMRELIYDSIDLQTQDENLCTMLSGGLDSSIISAFVADKYKKEGKSLTTFSLDYLDNDKNFRSSGFQPEEDAPYVEEMRKFINSDHRRYVIDSPQLADMLYTAADYRGLPGMADVDSSLLLFCEEIRKDFTVSVSGECADELFGGYPWYFNEEILFKDNFPWSISTDLRYSLIKPNLIKNAQEYVYEKYKNTVNATSYLDSDTKLNKRMREMFMLNYYWFMQTLVDRNDRMCSGTGLEVRTPYSDYRIVEYAYNIPWEIKALGGREKGLIRQAVTDLLPHDIIWRKKSPFPKTYNPIYLDIVCEKFKQIISNKNSRILEFLDLTKLQELADTKALSFNKPWYGQLMTNPQVLAYLIQVEYWLDKNKITIELR